MGLRDRAQLFVCFIMSWPWVVGRKESKVAQDPLRETLGRVNDWKKPERKRKNLIRLGGG